MDDPDLTTELLQQVIIEAIRLGAIPLEAVEKAQIYFEGEARHRDSVEQIERYETLTRMAAMLGLSASGPNGGYAAMWAEHRRKQTVLRTEWLEAKKRRERGE